MDTLPFKVIKTRKQYFKYCDLVWEMLHFEKKTKYDEDVIDLLTVLIEKWDDDHSTFTMLDPVEMLRSMMDEHKMKSVDMAKMLDVSTSLVSDILNYRRGFSKDIIRKLSERFKLRQDAFNRPYRLNPPDTPPKKKVVKEKPVKAQVRSVKKTPKAAIKVKKVLKTI
jgi:HTH-type transcriptional regulator/antitoxin HigA